MDKGPIEDFWQGSVAFSAISSRFLKFLENLAIGLGNSEEKISQTLSLLNEKLGAHGPTLDEHIQ